ncbi:MAG: transposase [Planctomycetota bacterium]
MFELFDPAAEYAVTESCHLPHWFQPGAATFITFRTEDSIPGNVSRRWHADRARWLKDHGIDSGHASWRDGLAALSVEHRRIYHETFSGRFMEYLDRGWGDCVLRKQVFATQVASALSHFDGERYHLGDFVIMPNHVHLIAAFFGDVTPESQCYSWKKFSAGTINRQLGRKGRFWQEESFDHLIRSPEQYDAIRRYIANNPSELAPGEYLLSIK